MDKPGALARDSSIKFWQRIPGVPNKLSRKHPVQPIRFSKAEEYKKDDRLLAVNKFAAPQSVDFPINAYTSVIEYNFAIGGKYYVETEQTYKTAPTGKQDWARTARKQMPLVQSKNGISSFIFLPLLGTSKNSLDPSKTQKGSF